MAITPNDRAPLALTLLQHEVLGAAFSALVDDRGRLVAAGFTDPETLVDETRARHRVDSVTECHDQNHPVRRALVAYQDGDLAAIDTLAVAPARTEFTGEVIKAMRAIAPGHPISYGELAARSGRPKAAQAAASVCAGNPVALVVPCHRVVRRGGTPGGAGTKQLLVDHERRYATV